MAKPATLIYECSRCRVQFPAYPLGDGPGMWKAILTATNQLAPGGPARLPLAAEHGCADGKLGIAYVVGMDPASGDPS